MKPEDADSEEAARTRDLHAEGGSQDEQRKVRYPKRVGLRTRRNRL